MRKTAKHWINGEWQAIGRETPSINPADGKPIGSYFDGGEAAAQAAIDAAFAAYRDWVESLSMSAGTLGRVEGSIATGIPAAVRRWAQQQAAIPSPRMRTSGWGGEVVGIIVTGRVCGGATEVGRLTAG